MQLDLWIKGIGSWGVKMAASSGPPSGKWTINKGTPSGERLVGSQEKEGRVPLVEPEAVTQTKILFLPQGLISFVVQILWCNFLRHSRFALKISHLKFNYLNFAAQI